MTTNTQNIWGRSINALAIALVFSCMLLARFDSALALILLMSSAAILLLYFIRTSRKVKAIIICAALVVASGALYRFVSPCLFVVCRPSSWEEQRDSAQSMVRAYGADFVPYSVFISSKDYYSSSHYQTGGEANLRLCFQFIRPMPTEVPATSQTAPYQLSAIDLNDRDPLRSRNYTPGAIWTDSVQLRAHADAFAKTQIGPREAIRLALADLKGRQGSATSLTDMSADLLLAENVPANLGTAAVWSIGAKVYSTSERQVIWVDAISGAILGQTVEQP